MSNKSTYSNWPLHLSVWLLASVFFLPMAVDALLGLTLLGLVIFGFAKGRNFNLDLTDPLWLAVSMLLLFLGASLFWSAEWDSKDVIQTWLRIILCFCFFVAVCESARDSQRYLNYLNLVLVVCVLGSAIACFVIFAITPPEDNRINGLFRINNAGKAGRMYAVALPFLVSGFLMNRGVLRVLFACAFLAAAIIIFLSDSRSAWLGGAIGVLIYVVALWGNSLRTFLKYATLFSMVLLGLLLAIVFHPDPEVTQALLPRGDSLRIAIWHNAYNQVMMSSPWFGNGFLSESHLQYGGWEIPGAHNIYLSAAIKSGFIGVLLFVCLQVLTTFRLLGHISQPIAKLGISLVAMGFVMLVFNGDRLIDKVNIVWFSVWLPVGIAMVLGRSTSPTEQRAEPLQM